jgi:hypothetical protein
MLPQVRVTDLLLEVDQCTDFTHLQQGLRRHQRAASLPVNRNPGARENTEKKFDSSAIDSAFKGFKLASKGNPHRMLKTI